MIKKPNDRPLLQCAGMGAAAAEAVEGARQRMHTVLQAYRGTHNFHNFTAGVDPREAAAKRYMQSLSCDAVLHIQVSPGAVPESSLQLACASTHQGLLTSQTCPQFPMLA